MSHSLVDMRSDVRFRIGESTANKWTDARVDSEINRAYDTMRMIITSRGLPYMLNTTDITTVANTQEYELSPSPANSIGGVYQVEFIETDPTERWAMEEIPMRDRSRWTGSSKPTKYYLRGDTEGDATVAKPTIKIGFAPVPSAAYTIRVIYYDNIVDGPTLTADGHEIDLPEGFGDWIVLKASIRLMEAEGISAEHLKQDLREVEDIILAAADPTPGQPRFIRIQRFG